MPFRYLVKIWLIDKLQKWIIIILIESAYLKTRTSGSVDKAYHNTRARSWCFPLGMCVFVYYTTCWRTCLLAEYVSWQFWLLSLQNQNSRITPESLISSSKKPTDYLNTRTTGKQSSHHGPAMLGLINQTDTQKTHGIFIVNTISHNHILCWLLCAL